MGWPKDFKEELDLEFVFWREAQVSGDELIAPFRDLLVDGKMLTKGYIRFIGVKQSQRRVSEYMGKQGSGGFKPTREIYDIGNDEVNLKGTHWYILDGVLEDTGEWGAWLGWDIHAAGYEIHAESDEDGAAWSARHFHKGVWISGLRE